MNGIKSYQPPSLRRSTSLKFLPKDRRRRLVLAGSAALLLVFGGLIFALIRAEMKNRELRGLIGQTSQRLERVHQSLEAKDLQKAYGDLNEAKRQMNAYLQLRPVEKAPAEEAAQPTPEQKKVLPAQATVRLPDLSKEIPYPFVYTGQPEDFLLCEKETKTLYVFRSSGGTLSLLKAYPCLIGANERDKRTNGDLATPVGVYFFLRFVPGAKLAEKYGYGAFVLNYPNLLDRKERRDGNGIWLHGHSAGKNLGDEIVNTQGCIVVGNDVLKEMSGYLGANGTPIVIMNKLSFAEANDRGELSKELTAFVEDWRRSWESRSVDKLMGHYAPEFVSADGMGYQAFKSHKEKVNRGKKFIRVATDRLALFLVPDRDGKYAVARFNQKYESSNFKTETRKILYLKKGQGGWQIIGESSF